MNDYSNMTANQLLEASEEHIETEHELGALLKRAGELASDCDPALATLCAILAECPAEIAAGWHTMLEELANRLHQDTDGPTIARAIACALEQFEE